jgi:serine/threonine protein kinase
VSPTGDRSWSSSTGSNTAGTTGSGRSTGSSTWSDPNRWTAADSAPLVSGSVVKERFVLEDELGRGGMGIVFKARDLRKEEAQDRNPYVALKILNEEFKRHPESLKALQRESRKAQNLAHPNVVTVYDFDRDGANVYMVMELLEGEALDRVIRHARESGLDQKEALRITRDMCRAMAYAHQQGIVHSDFKPANAFLTREGVVKVFDFGIARAAKRSDKAAGLTTLFDPGTLGALTPAYASCEMIEGLEPDPRDDVYAIACVTYELLTGKHPFDRMSAVRARDAKILPKPPHGLPRARWRALQRGLAFKREDRSATAIEFLNGVLPPKQSPSVYIGAGAAAVAVVVIATVVIRGQVTRYREQNRISALATGRASSIEPLLPELRSMDPAERNAILANEEARGGLIRYFEQQVAAATDPEKGHFDFPDAEALATDLRTFYPDSAAVKDISDRLTGRVQPAGAPRVAAGAQSSAASTANVPATTPASDPQETSLEIK